MTGGEVGSLRRIRWAVRAALASGVAASVAANVLHAQPNLISQVIAGWPPVALLIAVELVSRVPSRRRLGLVRIAATTVIAAIAGWVSYWHMTAVAHRFGETGLSAYLLPVSVDGLIVVASVSLVELAARIHTLGTASGTAGEPSTVATTAKVAAPGTTAAGAPGRTGTGVGEPSR